MLTVLVFRSGCCWRPSSKLRPRALDGGPELAFASCRGRELNPNIFFSNFSGASGISRQNPGISRQKSLIPWISRDIPNFLAPTRSRGRPPPHQKISGLKSLGLGSFFVPDHGPYKKILGSAALGPSSPTTLRAKAGDAHSTSLCNTRGAHSEVYTPALMITI